jgi:hypothetical protein
MNQFQAALDLPVQHCAIKDYRSKVRGQRLVVAGPPAKVFKPTVEYMAATWAGPSAPPVPETSRARDLPRPRPPGLAASASFPRLTETLTDVGVGSTPAPGVSSSMLRSGGSRWRSCGCTRRGRGGDPRRGIDELVPSPALTPAVESRIKARWRSAQGRDVGPCAQRALCVTDWAACAHSVGRRSRR